MRLEQPKHILLLLLGLLLLGGLLLLLDLLLLLMLLLGLLLLLDLQLARQRLLVRLPTGQAQRSQRREEHDARS